MATTSFEGQKKEPAAPPEVARTSGPETVRCTCGADVKPAGKGQCPDCGRFLPANTGALIHGGRRLELGRGTRLDEARRVEIRDAVLEDLGGRDEVSEVMHQLVEDFSAAVVLRNVAWQHIAAVGPLTKAGRTRAVVNLYLSASARAERLANQIGTKRKPVPVPSLTEYLEQRAEAEDESAGGRP